MAKKRKLGCTMIVSPVTGDVNSGRPSRSGNNMLITAGSARLNSSAINQCPFVIARCRAPAWKTQSVAW